MKYGKKKMKIYMFYREVERIEYLMPELYQEYKPIVEHMISAYDNYR